MVHPHVAAGRNLFHTRNPSRILVCLAFALSAWLSASTAQAQDPTDDVIRVRTDLVIVPCYVTNSRGARAAGLAQKDFRVRDNGRTVELSYFAAGTEHTALAFALDSSGSIRDVVNAQRDAALQLFSRFGRSSRVAVLHFGEKATLTLPFTSDADKASRAFLSHARAGERTAIFDAIETMLDAFADGNARPSERRILILISDGLDTISKLRPSAVIDRARALGVSIYVIHLPLFAPGDGRLIPRPPAKGYKDLASKTGGQYFVAGNAASALNPQFLPDLGPVFRAIEEDLQGQYVLGYYPDDVARETTSHKVVIDLVSGKSRGLRVHSLRPEYRLKN